MAREYARLLVSVWDDEDFTALTTAQQSTYWALISSPDLSWCGVAPLLPQRWAKAASDLNEKKVRDGIATLADRKFVIVDPDTAEIAVRSYIRHDGIMRQPNVVKAMVKALNKVHSENIQSRILLEIQKLWDVAKPAEREGRAWLAFAEGMPEAFENISGNPSWNPFENPSPNPLRKVS